MSMQGQRGRGSGQQPLCELPRLSAWGRGKRHFLAPVLRPAAPPRHREANGARASEEARHRPGAPRGSGKGTWQRPTHQNVPREVPRDKAREWRAGP